MQPLNKPATLPLRVGPTEALSEPYCTVLSEQFLIKYSASGFTWSIGLTGTCLMWFYLISHDRYLQL